MRPHWRREGCVRAMTNGQILMRFASGFWTDVELSAAELGAYQRHNDATVDDDARVAALETLLRSERTETRGAALDSYAELMANARHGSQPLIERLESAARAAAVRELRAPPYPASDGATNRRGANHGSAFRAMWAFVVSDDADLLAFALAKNDDPAVLVAGLKAAAGALSDVSNANQSLARVVRRLAADPAVDDDVRVAAIRAAGSSRDPSFEPAMLSLLNDRSLSVGAAVARALLKRSVERFRDVVEPVMATWPTGDLGPYDVVEARRLLDDDDNDGWA
jgi:hypothetical protein